MHRNLHIFSIIFIFTKQIFGATWVDQDTYLMWEIKNEYNIMYEYDWREANQYCDNLVLDGYSDWWLPSTTQLRTLSNIRLYGEYNSNWDRWFLANERYKNNGYFIKERIQYNMGTEGDYWSLSDYASSAKSEEEEVWFVDFEAGYDDWTYTSSQHYVRCVRSSY
jgi:hypothetical protein